jgi:hypothetical protein
MKLVLAAALLVIPVGGYLFLDRDRTRVRAERKRQDDMREASLKEARKRAEEEARKKREQEAAEAKKLQARLEEQRRMVSEATEIARGRFDVKPGAITLRSKILVWDVKSSTRETSVMDRLDAAKRADLGDSDVSVVLILDWTDVKTASYSSNRPAVPGGFNLDAIPGYRRDQRIVVVDWPTRTVVAAETVRGNDPPQTISRSISRFGGMILDRRPEYGDYRGPLATWIRSRLR